MITNVETLNEYEAKHPEVGYASVKGYYDQLAEAKVEYTCEESDLAIIGFECNEEFFKYLYLRMFHKKERK